MLTSVRTGSDSSAGCRIPNYDSSPPLCNAQQCFAVWAGGSLEKTMVESKANKIFFHSVAPENWYEELIQNTLLPCLQTTTLKKKPHIHTVSASNLKWTFKAAIMPHPSMYSEKEPFLWQISLH